MFDSFTFPYLRRSTEVLLQSRMPLEALAAMREMFYASLYRGAGGWFTKRVLVVDDSKVVDYNRRLLRLPFGT